MIPIHGGSGVAVVPGRFGVVILWGKVVLFVLGWGGVLGILWRLGILLLLRRYVDLPSRSLVVRLVLGRERGLVTWPGTLRLKLVLAAARSGGVLLFSPSSE